MPKLDAFDASTTEFTLNSNNFAAYTVQHVLLILSKKYSSISMEELLKVHTHQSSPLSEIINQLTTLVFSTSIFDSFAHVELLLQVLNENAPMYLASYLTLQRDESLMLQIVRILSFIVEEQQGKVSFQSLLPPLICVMGLVTTTRQVKSAILILIHFICDSKQKQSIKYNPLGLTLIQSGTAIKLFKSIRKGMNASNQQLSTFHNFKGSVAELANFISSYMKAFNNGVVQMRLLTQLIKFGLHREISHALVESMLLPMLKQVNLGQPFESAEKMSALSDIIHYLINFHIGRRDANERELKLFLRLMAMTSQPGCLEPLAHSNIVEAFSPSYIFGTLLKEKNAKDFYADMNSENKLKFALIVSNILSNEEKGSPLTLVYMDIIQAAQLDVTTVLHLFSRCTNIESQTQLLEMFALTSVQPHPKIISKIFDLMKSFRNGSSQLNGKDQSEKMVDSDDESESSDSDTSDADSSDSDTDSSDSDNESDSPAIERKVKKTISFEDSLFFVTCFNVLHSMISRVADDLKQNPHDNILEQCSESFDLEETMKILSKSNHPQLFHSAMHCVDAMAQIFPSRMLNYVSKIVKIISSSFEENNATAIEISEKLMVRLLPQLTQNADDVFPFLNMLINSFQAIPAFRRLRLYTTLLKSISRKYTFSLIVLFLEKYIEDSMPVYRDFCFELLDYFNAEKQCFCLEQMANYIASIMREPTNAAQIRSNALFGISSAKSSRSEEFIASVVIALAEFAQTYVEQDTFLRRITDSLSSIEEEETRDEYNDVLQQYLLNITALSIATMTDAKHFQYEKKRPDPGKRTTLMHHLRSDKLYKIALDTFAIIQQIMDAKSNAGMYSSLLNPESKLYSQLLGESDDERRNSRIQAKAVDQLNLLLADMSFENSEFLLANADQYSKLVRSISKKVFKRDVPERNLQLCLITVDQLARRFAHLHEAQFARVVPQIVEKIRQSNNMMMDASCALALASICGAPLKNQGESDDKSVTRDVLDQIPVAFEAVVETMIETLRSENGNKSMTLYLNGMLSSLAHMVKYCGMYASPYLNGIIDILLQVSMSAISEQVQGLVHDIIEGLTQHLSVPVLIRPLFQSLSTARRIGSQSMSTLFGILSTLFSSMDTAEATRVSEKVVKFYTQAFNTRFESSKSSLINIDDMDSVEREIVDSFKIFVLKLEEDQFASILKELQKWATSGVELNPMRLRTYYRVITKLSSTLKSLFVPYWNTIITQTVGHLKSTTGSPTAEKKRKRSSTADLQDDMHHMTVYIMDALQDLCLYDESNDVARDEDLLKSIYQTLIDHLLNLSCGTPDDYTERMEHMIPALVALAKIAPQKEWNPIQKTVAQQVTAVLNMDLSESQKSQYLVSAVSTLRALYSETPNFITQLADILPTVSELLEENDPLVQQELSNFIQFLQKESGEDIREYLSRS
uniref:HEAT repeat-containing protein 1 n=1 Tax=Percolomonas cosmopolitus TaxID=63605 RepID=A0A7S1KQ43_9EUKA